ncbi:hypothetical protein ACFVAD_00050 [Sutcliffiella sp. NPDC057660]|uniref:hypothetical protein n=1 Tax=Sutcliffiella sp. NPDC057660 TaxID=3346199 RepID=UPI0036C47DDB
MGVKIRENKLFFLTLIVTFLAIYAACFHIADTYSHLTAEVKISGELLTEEDFQIPLPLETQVVETPSQKANNKGVEEQQQQEQQDKADSNKETPVEEEKEEVKESEEHEKDGSNLEEKTDSQEDKSEEALAEKTSENGETEKDGE